MSDNGTESCLGELQIRTPSIEGDLLMLRWWELMHRSGELTDVFPERAETPSGFLALFGNPETHLFYRADERGLAVCMWFEPFMGNMALGMWCRKDWRHRRWWDDLLMALQTVLSVVPMIFYFTKRQHVLESGIAVGFVSVGTVPYLYRGEPGHLAYITREIFEERYGKLSGIGQQGTVEG